MDAEITVEAALPESGSYNYFDSLRSLRISVISALTVVGEILNAEIKEIRRERREDFKSGQERFLAIFPAKPMTGPLGRLKLE